jgi:hypothetical protein
MTRLEPGNPIIMGNITLIIIARLSIQTSSAGPAGWLHASKEPYALVIREEQGLRAHDMAGQPMEMELLIEDIPELEAICSCDQ